MSRIISRAESWERVYQSFQSVNFAAFDYNTIKQSIIDYIKLTFPESFNDYIESSEFIAIVESFAYVAELIAYRIDLNAHENFISTAQRRDSILRLAKLVSYTASRPLPARGLVKLSSISTTENILDANGIDLANRTIRWNDNSNPSWKEQFILLMNRVLEQEFGSVSPLERFQVQDVLFEIYGLSITPINNGVFSYSAVVNGSSVPLELVPVSHDSSLGIVERRPENNVNFTLLYGSDGLGDASETTGFFCFTKQGSLQKIFAEFDGITPNQVFNVETLNVNDTDVWVNAVDPVTRAILDEPPSIAVRNQIGRSGEWVQVDLAHAQNVIFNTNPNRNKYELETRESNKIRVIFGDGEFADIPGGTFEIWVRSSLDEDVVVPQSSIVDTPTSFTYVDDFGKTQTFTFTFSLISSLQNASAAEDTEHVRVTAPAVYYTQDRMVNGEDYNTFMLQDPSILKLRSVNRTFAGDSQYIPWHDASQTYENVKIFSDDGILYLQEKQASITTPDVNFSTLISAYVEPLLSSTDILLQLVGAGVPLSSIRREFSTAERDELLSVLTPAPALVDMYFDKTTYVWRSTKRVLIGDTVAPPTFVGYPTNFITSPLISIDQPLALENVFDVSRRAKRVVLESPTTTFWNTNDSNRVVEYDTLSSHGDEIIILKANTNYNRDGILQQNWHFDVIGLETIESGVDTGLADTHRVTLLPADENGDNIPDNLDIDDASTPGGIADIIKPKLFITGVTNGDTIELPLYIVGGKDDVSITRESTPGSGVYDTPVTFVEFSLDTNNITKQVQIVDAALTTPQDILLSVREYVYFSRFSISDPWVVVETSYESIASFVADEVTEAGLWQRYEGRDSLNFAWFHRSPRYHLVDPSPTNIIDTFIIPKGYYISLKRWLEDPLAVRPSLPTPLDLHTTYGYLLDNKMISDTVILHPGKIKLIFGSRAPVELRAVLKVIRSPNSTITNNQIKTTIVSAVRNFFDITTWEFGETFYFTELASHIHTTLPTDVSSVVLVPTNVNHQFGDLFQLSVREDEILYPDITVDDIEIVTGFTSTNLRFNS